MLNLKPFMSSDLIAASTLKTLLSLEQLPEQFYLTGSRFFGTYNTDSDYDYFTEHTWDIERKLKNLGFLPTTEYCDKNTVIVFRHSSGVDVQLVTDVNLKLSLQRMIRNRGMLPTDKSQATQLWDLLYSVYSLGQATRNS